MKKCRQEYKVSGHREHVGHHDKDCNETMIKKGFTAFKNGTWEEFLKTFRKKMKASGWAFDRFEEAFELVPQFEAEKMSIGGQGGVTMSYLCPHCNSFPLEDYVWWVSGEKSTNWWCASCGEQYDWKQPNRLFVVLILESF